MFGSAELCCLKAVRVFSYETFVILEDLDKKCQNVNAGNVISNREAWIGNLNLIFEFSWSIMVSKCMKNVYFKIYKLFNYETVDILEV